MDALIGYTGFVGSHILGKIDGNVEYYNSKNIEKMANKQYRHVYCSGLYAEKWKINLNPEEDLRNIEKLKEVLKTIECSAFFLISTIDVLESGTEQNEGTIPPHYSSHSYGCHRREMEVWSNTQFKNCFIFRLPALFGRGLKKNALYDLIHKNNIHKLRSHWVFQWYNLEWLYEDIQYFYKKDIHLVHLITEPLPLRFIKNIFFPKEPVSDNKDSEFYYRFNTKYPRHTLQELIECMAIFIHENKNKNKRQRLQVSEMAWEPEQDEVMRTFLKREGLESIEAVPSKKNWNLESYEQIYSAQSLLYGINIQIFEEPEKFIQHIEKICRLLEPKGTKILIFGSPKQRIWSGENATELFWKVGEVCKKYNMIFCLENNSRKYGGNWMYSVADCLKFIREVAHSNIQVSLDIGNLLMEKEELLFSGKNISFIKHVQVSFEGLGAWDKTKEESILEVFAQLKKLNYQGNISLEMKYDGYLPFEEIKRFIEVVEPYIE